MTLLRQPAPRFLVWATFLVGVAAATGVAGLSGWTIAAIEFAAWVLVAMCERTLSGPWTVSAARVYLEPPSPAARFEALAPVDEPVVAEPPQPTRVPQPEHEEAPVQAAPAPPAPIAQLSPAAGVATRAGTQWSIWALERMVQEQEPDNEELGFLLVYLRDFADANGLLPAGFDSLVRESFGHLLPSPG